MKQEHQRRLLYEKNSSRLGNAFHYSQTDKQEDFFLIWTSSWKRFYLVKYKFDVRSSSEFVIVSHCIAVKDFTLTFEKSYVFKERWYSDMRIDEIVSLFSDTFVCDVVGEVQMKFIKKCKNRRITLGTTLNLILKYLNDFDRKNCHKLNYQLK